MATIYIYSEIGTDSWWFDTVSANMIAEQLSLIPVGEAIELRINSVGGDVGEALAIYNLLSVRRENVTTHIDGYALSAASFIALAGATVISPESSLWMIHNPSTFMWGTATDFRKSADVLDKHRDAISSIYSERTGQSTETINEWLEAESWFTGSEAVSKGFATQLTSDTEAVEIAKVDNLIPAYFANRMTAHDRGKVTAIGWKYTDRKNVTSHPKPMTTNKDSQPNQSMQPPTQPQPSTSDHSVVISQLEGKVEALSNQLSEAMSALKERDDQIVAATRKANITSRYAALRLKAQQLNGAGKLSKAQFDRLFPSDVPTAIENVMNDQAVSPEMILGRIEGALDVADLATPIKTKFDVQRTIEEKPAEETPTGEPVEEYANRLIKNLGKVGI